MLFKLRDFSYPFMRKCTDISWIQPENRQRQTIQCNVTKCAILGSKGICLHRTQCWGSLSKGNEGILIQLSFQISLNKAIANHMYYIIVVLLFRPVGCIQPWPMFSKTSLASVMSYYCKIGNNLVLYKVVLNDFCKLYYLGKYSPDFIREKTDYNILKSYTLY